MEDLQANEEYSLPRKRNNLPHKYEYNHFIIEGRVLYLLDQEGFLIDRTMYKIKPHDIEEVHWSNFDATMQGRVREAVEKIILREKPLTEESLKEELDMGDKEWSRFGEDSWKYAQELKTGDIPSKINDKRRLVVVGGLPGSGREVFVNQMKKTKNWIVLGRDLTDAQIRDRLLEELKQNCNVCIDGFNVTPRQRKNWTEIGMQMGVLHIEAVYFDVSQEICQKNLQEIRAKMDAKQENFEENSRYLRSQEDEIFKAKTSVPESREGFGEISIVRSLEEANKVLEKYVA